MGFALTPSFEKSLQKLPALLLAHFTQGGDFLEKVIFEEKIYFGKQVPALTKMEGLIDLQKNIISLALCMVPQYHVCPNQVTIFPLDGKHNY